MKCMFLFLIGFLLATSASAGDMMIKVQKVKRVIFHLVPVSSGAKLKKMVPSTGNNNNFERQPFECLQVTGLFEGSNEPSTYVTCSCKNTSCFPTSVGDATVTHDARIAESQFTACEANVKLSMLRPGQFGIDMAKGWCALDWEVDSMYGCWALNACELQAMDK